MMNYENKSMGERICENKGFYIPEDTSKKQRIKDRQMQRKLKKLKINKMQTTLIAIGIVIAIVFLCIVLIKVSDKPNIAITDNTNFEKLDVSKYNEEILAMYNREGQAKLFEEEMSRIQNIIGTYIIENMTNEEDSLEKILDEISSELKSENWNKILSNRSKYYLGQYSLDENGNLKFKFESKSVEPSWASDESVSKYIILN